MNFLRLYSLLTLIFTLTTIGNIQLSKAEEDNIGGEVGDVILVPAEAKQFISSDFYPIYLKQVDLNRDKLLDYLIVLENNIQKAPDTEDSNRGMVETERPLIIIQRTEDGRLKKVKQNNKVVYCRICGGVFGDPFEGITVKENGFSVHMYGGSNWRWASNYEFSYSRIDKTWQLVNVSGTSYHTSNPDDTEITNYKPPKDFGKIDLADFDPDNFLYKDTEKKDE